MGRLLASLEAEVAGSSTPEERPAGGAVAGDPEVPPRDAGVVPQMGHVLLLLPDDPRAVEQVRPMEGGRYSTSEGGRRNARKASVQFLAETKARYRERMGGPPQRSGLSQELPAVGSRQQQQQQQDPHHHLAVTRRYAANMATSGRKQSGRGYLSRGGRGVHDVEAAVEIEMRGFSGSSGHEEEAGEVEAEEEGEAAAAAWRARRSGDREAGTREARMLGRGLPHTPWVIALTRVSLSVLPVALPGLAYKYDFYFRNTVHIW